MTTTLSSRVERDSISAQCHFEPIAIIGVGCRFPGGADDAKSFWRLLSHGTDAIVEVPRDRFNIERFYAANPAALGKTTSRWGGFVQQRIELFDAAFFGMSPREASYLDPMQRWLMEVSWEALEDAGLPPEQVAGTDTSVFIGGFTEDIKLHQMAPSNRELIGPHAATGSAMTMIANRLSHLFDLHGPSVALDTACSSSLVAVHLACQSLWNGESPLALAGGVNVMFRPEYTIAESKAGMLSPDGRSKAFDARANGYVRGEGAGVVVLKPLSRALAEGDRIYAVIRGTGANQDGRTHGITVPSARAQESLIRRVCERAGVLPGAIQYVEAHGTGTPVGDPIEAEALGRAFGVGRPARDRCWIGSVKTNIGHLEAAAGIAGLIKVALALKYGAIPPHLHLENPNPAIDFEALGLQVPRELEPWPESEGARLASVNSFGFGGTNAHVVLEAAPSRSPATLDTPTDQVELFVVSASSERALAALTERYREILSSETESPDSLRDLCFSATVRRSHHEHRLALCAASRDALLSGLAAFANRELVPGVFAGVRARERPSLVFVFGGMGPQWWAMGRKLLAQEAVFRDFVKHCDDLLRRHARWSLWDELTAGEPASRMSETQIAQPASFALQAGLAALFRSWGVTPDAVVGHSAGEVAAAYEAGVYDLEQAVEIIYHRSRLQHLTTGQGKLVAVGVPAEEARALLSAHAGGISIAAVNGPTAVTLVGDQTVLESFVRPLQERDVFVRFLHGDVPYHSHYMDPLKAELFDVLGHLRPQPATVPLFSTVSGERADGREWDASYWWRNVRDTVLFAPSVEALANHGFEAFLELGAHPVLGSSIEESFTRRGGKATVLTSLRRQGDDRALLMEALARLYVAGFGVDFRGVYAQGERFVSLPLYAWQRERHWVESQASERDRLGPTDHELLGERRDSTLPSWESRLDLEQLSYLKDHVVRGSVVYPGAAYVEMMLRAGQELFGESTGALEITGLEFQKALFLTQEVPVRIELVYDAERDKVSIASRTDARPTWVRHASATLTRLPRAAPGKVSLSALRQEHGRNVPLSTCYRYLKDLGLEYGPSFSQLSEFHAGVESSLALIESPASQAAEATPYILHPTLLDAAFQAMLVTTLPVEPDQATQRVYLPTRIASIRVHGKVPQRLWVRSELLEFDERRMRGDLLGFDEAGNVVLELTGVVARSLEHSASAGALDETSLFYGIEWEHQAEARDLHGTEPGTWLVLADQHGFGETLAQHLEASGNECVLAFAGKGFRTNPSETLFTLDPASIEDVRRLVDAVLSRAERPVRGILHLFGLDAMSGSELNLAEIDRGQALGPLPLLHLVQALELCTHPQLPRIWAVTRGVQSLSSAPVLGSVVEATVWGMMRVVRYQEHPDRFGGLIDLDPSRPSDEVARFAADLTSGKLRDEVAYRGGERFVPRFVAKPELAKPSHALQFRADGSYLVTGGLGGLGLLVARWMVEQGARRLILLGRSALPPRDQWSAFPLDTPAGERLRAVRELEALGASVHTVSIDVADEPQLVSFLTRYRSEGWPPIRGVMHAAGVSRPHLMAELSREEYLETARPKVRGAWLLHQHLAADPLDFFVLFSSVAAFAFTAGQADYAAANAFLDALAHYRRGHGLPAISINWGPWAEAGMATLLGDYFHKRGTTPFPPESGLATLGSLLAGDATQATVLWISDPRVFASNNFSSGAEVPLITHLLEGASLEERQASGGANNDATASILASDDPVVQLEQSIQYVQGVLSRVLRFTGAPPDRNVRLGDLGLDSLLALELKNRIANELRVTVSVVELLKGPSVEVLATRVHGLLVDTAVTSLDDSRSAPVTGDLTLGPNQRWFVSRNLPNPNHWNMTTLWEVIRPLEAKAVQEILRALLAQHDLLRARFSRTESAWQQTISPPDESVPFTHLDYSGLPEAEQDRAIEARIAEFQAKLDLFHGPVVQLVYFARGPTRRDWLLVVIHHLVADVFSLQIVLSDLQLAYDQLAQGKPVALPVKTTSFKAWVDALARSTRSNDTAADLVYWTTTPWLAATRLPLDYADGRENNSIASTKILTRALSAGESSTLLHGLHRVLEAQVMDALLFALSQAFHAVMGVSSLLLDVIVHGRENLSDDMDLSRTVGLFAHGIPLLLGLPESGETQPLRSVSQQLERFSRHGRTYAALRWLSEDEKVVRLLQSLPKREVIFNYVGQFEPPRSETALLKAVQRVPPALEDPRNGRDFLIQCQVGLLNGRFTALWSYSAGAHRPSTIERLSETFFEALASLAKQVHAAQTRDLHAPAKATPVAAPKAAAMEGGE